MKALKGRLIELLDETAHVVRAEVWLPSRWVKALCDRRDRLY